MNINCVIIDDEPLAQKLIKGYVEKLPFLNLLGTFVNPIQAIPFLNSNNVDIIFLDIEMGEMSGLDLANTIGKNTKIIFTTAYSQHAVKSYELNALDYLVKPINFERFVIAVNKFFEKEKVAVKPEEKIEGHYIFLKTGSDIVKLDYDDIYFIEAMKDYVSFQTDAKKIIVHNSLKNLEETLPAQFCRVHNSYMVNLKKIIQIKDNHVYVKDIKIAISKKYRDNFLSIIKNKSL